MRLTLRTLLAYLDDTLEASEIKQIGQKVAESDAAQELVARIKQVTRRRRLTTPSDAGPDQPFDANRVSGYLDNDLSSEEVADLEKLCLESDVHLAEMAACHQILTLVLGEPALIPPTARRRMYGLIQGRPARASRPTPVARPSEPTPAATASGRETDPDDSLMALPLFRDMPWLRWALPLGAVVLLAVLGVILFVQPGGTPEPRLTRKPDNSSPTDPGKTTNDAQKTTPTQKTTESTQATEVVKKTMDGGPVVPSVQPIPPVEKPLPGRQPVGTFASQEKVVVRQTPEGWNRLAIGDQVQTSEPLVSLPGYRSELKLERKVDLLLWGNLPETQLQPLPLLESAITLHATPSSGVIDADLTLQRGRIYLTNKKEKGPARIRLRFWREEVWDITLDEPDAAVGVELISLYLPELKPREGEEPFVYVALYVLRGTAALKVDRRTFGDLKAAPGKALVEWDNKGAGLAGPRSLDQPIPLWDIEQQPPRDAQQLTRSRQLTADIKELAGALTDPMKKVAVAILEFTEDKRPEKRMLGVRCLAAIDAVPELLDALAKEDTERFDVRQEALFALMKNWLARGKEQAPKLYDSKNRTGLLLDKGYSNDEAQIVLGLLFGPSDEERKQRELYDVLISYLMHRRLIVRELAIRHLLFLTGEQFRIAYNPGSSLEMREEGYKAWKKLLDMGKLPPAPPPPR